MKQTTAQQSAYRVALSGLLVALMLVLGYIESLIPLNIGVPGIKLGLSNGVLIFAVYMLDIPAAFCLMALKVLLSGLMFGGVSAIAYAFAGGLLSLTCMCLLSRIRWIHPMVVSMLGGLLHNVGQVGLAMAILQTNLLGYLAILVLVGGLCGALTGLCASGVMNHLRALKWKVAPRHNKKQDVLVIMLALLLCGGLCALSLHAITKPKTNVTIQISSEEELEQSPLMQP